MWQPPGRQPMALGQHRARSSPSPIVRLRLLLPVVALLGANAAPAGEANRGAALFLSYGCGSCHTVRGTEARGTLGPDLTHVGSRRTIGAGLLPTSTDTIEQFVSRPDQLKPGVKMPNFDMVPVGDLHALAAYLKGLQ
jgi:cytochrome c oxidase subunit 2